MYYRHNLDYKYPDRSDEHMITVEHLRDVNVDASYPYLDKSFRFKVIRSLYWLAITTVVFPLMRFSHGLKIYGKKNIIKPRFLLGLSLRAEGDTSSSCLFPCLENKS